MAIEKKSKTGQLKKQADKAYKAIARQPTVEKKSSAPISTTTPPIQLNADSEIRFEAWKAKEADKESFIAVWGSKLATVRRKVRDLNRQYQKILYKQLQAAYEVYDNVLRSEYDDEFFSQLRGFLYDQGFKVQKNTSDSALIIRYIFGVETATKTVHDYSRALDGALHSCVDTKDFADWLERKTLTKVIEEQRALKKETETPAERLDRARRVILRMIEIRETNPIVKFTRIEPEAEKLVGNRMGLCVMLGFAYRTFGRGNDGLDVDINLNVLIPPALI